MEPQSINTSNTEETSDCQFSQNKRLIIILQFAKN